MSQKPINIEAIPTKKGQTIYPSPLDVIVAGRSKKKLGDVFNLSNFGVNHTTLAPGAASALLHMHATQDEFIYILEGVATAIIGDEQFAMKPGDFVGFKAGTKLGHQLVNNSNSDVIYLEIGDRSPNDIVEYPNDDLKATLSATGSWMLSHKDGTPY